MNSPCITKHLKDCDKLLLDLLHLCPVELSQETNTLLRQNLTCGLSEILLDGLPNKSNAIQIGDRFYPSSVLELHRPTGKYISRLLVKLFNAFSRKGIIRYVGNACAPGLFFPELETNQGIEQFRNLQKSCPIITVNTLGHQTFPDSVTVKAEPYMVIDLPKHWEKFEDYLNAFSSKYRVRTKKVYEETKHLQIQYLNREPPNTWAAQCGSLLAESLQDKTIAIGKNLPALLRCYQQALGANFHIVGFIDQGEIIGFVSYIIDQNRMFAMHLGINRRADVQGKLYQRMLYTLVEEAFKNGANHLNLGRTGAEIKSTLGATPVENSFVVFTKSKALLVLFRLYVKFVQKKFIYTYRSPFKTSALQPADAIS